MGVQILGYVGMLSVSGWDGSELDHYRMIVSEAVLQFCKGIPSTRNSSVVTMGHLAAIIWARWRGCWGSP